MAGEPTRLRGIGEVVAWDGAEGIGEVVVTATGDQVRVRAGDLDIAGARYLEPGGTVEVDYEPTDAPDDDGFRFHARRVVIVDG